MFYLIVPHLLAIDEAQGEDFHSNDTTGRGRGHGLRRENGHSREMVEGWDEAKMMDIDPAIKKEMAEDKAS